MGATSPTSPAGEGRSLPIWGFLVIVVIYLVIIQGVGLAVDGTEPLTDGKFLEVDQVLVQLWIPLGLALLFTYGVIAALGWFRPVLRDDHPVQRWVWLVPAVFLVGIAITTSYGALAERGLVFTLALLVATQFVGWGEEGMFRGIGVVTLRRHGLTEGEVALWSSVIFGAVHLTNVVGHGLGALPQAMIVSFAGYFFYLTRRVSKGNAVNSVVHGLFDFSLITATQISTTASPLALVSVLVYLVVGILVLARRHRIELPAAAAT
jgi:uncharacterized protein